MEEFNEVIKKIKTMPIVEPNPDLTAMIMGKIKRIGGTPFEGVWRDLLLLPRSVFTASPTKGECAISFISMGLFYLIFDLLLTSLVKNIPVSSEMNYWLKLQSPVLILVALLLTCVGIAVWFMGGKAVRFARWGLVIYVLMFITSSALISTAGKFASLLGAGLLVAAILTGISLNFSMGKYAYNAKISKG
jgi:hypothetical protein